MSVIKIENLTKTYRIGFWGKPVKILNGVNLSVGEGETFGLLGPNGAGKTTTLKIIVGLVRPSSGKVIIMDRSPNNISLKEQMGFLPENPYVYVYLTGIEFLLLCSKLYFQKPALKNRRLKEVTETVGLSTYDMNKQVKTYSKGMLQRLCLAQALLNDPQLLFLDEPMSGLDPVGRYEFKKIILSLKEQGKTIFFNSHIISDVQEICDSIAIMANGKILKSGKIKDLSQPVANIYQLTASNLSKVGQTNLKRMSLRLLVKDNEVIATFHDIENALKAIAVIKQSGGKLISLAPHKTDLEEIFMDTIKGKTE